jgi:CRP-like cAMP-binding protein
MSEEIIKFNEGDIICEQGAKTDKLYFVVSGKLLVFGVEGTKVTPFAEIGGNEFVGELSFFDGEKRSAYVMATEDCNLIEITESDKEEQMPDWMLKFSRNLTKRLRNLDGAIMQKGIKRKKAESVSALSIDEQRAILDKIHS